jgi:hypothetical protein
MGVAMSRALAGIFGKKEMRASLICRFCHVTPTFFDPNSLFRYSYGNAHFLACAYEPYI